MSHREEGEEPRELSEEEASQVFPFFPEWMPLSVDLVRDMETLPHDAIAVCVWLSFRWWDAVERAHGEGRRAKPSEAAESAKNVARAIGAGEERTLAALAGMEARGIVARVAEGWFLTRYAIDP